VALRTAVILLCLCLCLCSELSASADGDSLRLVELKRISKSTTWRPVLKVKVLQVADSGLWVKQRKSLLFWQYHQPEFISVSEIVFLRQARAYGRTAVGCGIGTLAGVAATSVFVHAYSTRPAGGGRGRNALAPLVWGSLFISGGALAGSIIGEESRPKIKIRGNSVLFEQQKAKIQALRMKRSHL
jgi:hypothetical protein